MNNINNLINNNNQHAILHISSQLLLLPEPYSRRMARPAVPGCKHMAVAVSDSVLTVFESNVVIYSLSDNDSNRTRLA